MRVIGIIVRGGSVIDKNVKFEIRNLYETYIVIEIFWKHNVFLMRSV